VPSKPLGVMGSAFYRASNTSSVGRRHTSLLFPLRFATANTEDSMVDSDWNSVAAMIVVGVVLYILRPASKQQKELAARSALVERQNFERDNGVLNPQMVCPHCTIRGAVHVRPVTEKKGISGAKVTGALFTSGVSLFATGLSRKEDLTRAYCDNCRAIWTF
jgi:hypothetical protein